MQEGYKRPFASETEKEAQLRKKKEMFIREKIISLISILNAEEIFI